MEYEWGEKIATFFVANGSISCVECIYWIPVRKAYLIRHTNIYEMECEPDIHMELDENNMPYWEWKYDWVSRPDRSFWYDDTHLHSEERRTCIDQHMLAQTR